MEPGTLVADRFKIERLAGSGGMGAVYRARDIETGELVALKVLLGAGKNLVDRFMRESHVLAELRHPGIVRFIAHGETPGKMLFMAMEWLEGIDLEERLAQRGFTVPECVEMIGRIADALSVAHQRGVIHRDIKPGNLFLPGGDVEQVKVLDFGVARLGRGGRAMTRTGILVGTPGYMAPEQARGADDVDARADIFALGSVMFECLTGRYAFEGEHVMAVLAKILVAQPPRVSEVRADVPAAVDDLVARMMHKDRDSRPRDGAALADEILALGSLTSGVRMPSIPPVSALTTGEQRLLSVVMARMRRGPDASAVEVIDLRDAWHKTIPGDLPPDGNAPSDPAAFLESLRKAAVPFSARTEGLADGTVLALLTASGAATDQAAQAAGCALAMRVAAPDARMALATGRGEVGELPSGEAIDRAAALLRMREPEPQGGHGHTTLPVRIDEVTAGLLDLRFECAGDEAGLLLVAAREAVATSRTLLGKATPVVGRDRELAALDAALSECVNDSVARVLLVTGAPGVGKSRVRDEFTRRIRARGDAVEVWIGRGDPMSAGAPFQLIGKAVRRAAGIVDGEAQSVREQKLVARVGRHVSEAERDRVARFLGEICGIPFDDRDRVQLRAARQDAVLMGDQMRRAWEDFVVAECAAQPLVLLLEDLQWGDLPSVKFVDAALRAARDGRFLVVGIGRPEVHELFPRVWSERSVQELRLGELSRKASERLIRMVLGDELPPATVARLAERSGGNAYFLEELIRAVADGKGDALPETLIAMVQARVEALDPEARRFLRAASVFGEAFWESGVRALMGGARTPSGAGTTVSDLIEREVIAARSETRFPGEREYVFRNAFMREAAYAMLTSADRALGHRLAAQWLESAGERNAVLLAEQYERGQAPERAAEWYRSAATAALEAGDFDTVMTCAERGVACGASGALRGQLRRIQAEALRWSGKSEEALPCAKEAIDLAPRGTAGWFEAVGEYAGPLMSKGDVAELVRIGEAVRDAPFDANIAAAQMSAWLKCASQLTRCGQWDLLDAIMRRIDENAGHVAATDPTIAGRVHVVRGLRALAAGDLQAYLQQTVAAVEHFEQAGDRRTVCSLQADLGYGCIELGLCEDALRALTVARNESTRMGLGNVTSMCTHNLGLVLARLGRLDEGERMEREAVAAFQSNKDRRLLGGSLAYLAEILLMAGRAADAAIEAERAVEILSPYPPVLPYALGVLTNVYLAQGQRDAALAVARRSRELLDGSKAIETGEALLRVSCAEALETSGAQAEALGIILVARDRLLSRAAGIRNEQWRDAFLHDVPENARTLALAEAWERQG